MKRQYIQILIHVLAWVIFLSLPTFFKPVHPGDPQPSIINDLLYTPRLFNSLLLIAVFYFNYYVAIPLFYFRRRYIALALSFIISFAALLFISELMRPPDFKHELFSLSKAIGPSHNLFMFINVYVFSYALSMYMRWKRVREEKLNTEVSFLKAQINPHFLFNTLNSIYSLTIVKSDKAPDAVVKLSSLMRYSVTDAERTIVPLSKELGYIKDYIGLQQLRLTDKVKVRLNISGDDTGKEIAPFMLTPFIENAFKHGVNSEEDCLIVIDIKISENIVHMRVSNNKVYVQKDEYSVSGLGIKNTQKRLKYLYPKKHELIIDDNDDHFVVQLKIELT